MNPMHAAIRSRLGKHSPAPDDAQPMHPAAGADHTADHAESGKDLHGFVAGLSHDEKSKLKSILNDSSQNTQAIAKGGPSSEEQGKIAQAMAQENQMNALDEASEHEGISEDQSDEIGKSMLDSRHINGMATEKPKNLGERAKQYIAAKLKAKGKI